MEFLKDLFGGQALTFEQMQTAAQGKGFRVVNAAGGAYVPKADADNLQAQIGTLTTQLGEANGKLSGFDPAWKEKAEAEKNKLDAMKFDFALDKALAGSGAKSAAAIRGLLDRGKLTLADDGGVIGLSEQLEALKKSEDTAFLFSQQQTQKTGMTHQGGGTGAPDKKEEANEALRALFGKEN